jgi:hypothetical protein
LLKWAWRCRLSWATWANIAAWTTT